MEAAFEAAFGVGRELAWYQMSARAALVFLATWLLLRAAGRRTFAQKTAFDLCIMLLLGAILSRAVAGASPILGTLAAAAVLVFMHRLVCMLSATWPAIDRVVSGRPIVLVKDGREDRQARRRAMLSDEDLDANARAKLHTPGWDDQRHGRGDKQWDVVLERDGQISFVEHPGPPRHDAPRPTHPRTEDAHAPG
ncbi:hypothetical protein D9X30_1260 [Cupriavidus sp. U2]|uniref:DUF421 domain-containing protein n=1 Tax=Cupriavidus sp. U2 TaxID=2920269 RepID=UPI00129D5E00|nr:DUF421 domain-containing protein [Cupriavidus sp. U2]KAI3593533.1 hypothetical protein D9X30_1260 [Cupriavidus sp. U2]